MEVDLLARLGPNLTLRGAFTHAIDGAGRIAAESYGSGSVTWANDRLSVNLNGQLRSEESAMPGQPGYKRLNASIGFQMTPAIRLQGTVRNLTDRQIYQSTDLGPLLLPGLPTRGREFNLMLRWERPNS